MSGHPPTCHRYLCIGVDAHSYAYIDPGVDLQIALQLNRLSDSLPSPVPYSAVPLTVISVAPLAIGAKSLVLRRTWQ